MNIKSVIMKLELKYLAPYLPYGLNVLRPAYKATSILDSSTDEEICEMGVVTMISMVGDNKFGIKPILRPLSDLMDESREYDYFIENIVEGTNHNCDAYFDWMESFIDNPDQTRILQAPYEVFQLLLEEKFDVFGLIEACLAVDINTINQ